MTRCGWGEGLAAAGRSAISTGELRYTFELRQSIRQVGGAAACVIL